MGSWDPAASQSWRSRGPDEQGRWRVQLIFISDPSYPLVNFFFCFVLAKNEQADSTFFSVETDMASTGSPLSSLQAQGSTPSARRW